MKTKVKKSRASPEKIAFYIKNISEKEKDSRKIISVIDHQFNQLDIKRFAKKYKDCSNEERVRQIANLIFSIPSKDINRSIDMLKGDISE